MRIAFVLAALQAGGAERVIAQITRRAVSRGWQVTVIAFDSPGDPIYHALDPAVRVRRLALPPAKGGRRGLLRNMARARALRAELRAGQFDVVVSFLTKINVLSLLAADRRDRVIVSERNNPERQGANPIWNGATKLLYRRAKAAVVMTERAKRTLPSGIRQHTVIIQNPVEMPPPCDAVRSHPPTLVAVGRLTRQKGFDILLDAFAVMASDLPDWHLTIWGEGPERAALEAQRDRLGLNGRVTMPGETEVPRGWIAAADAFVLSSRYEGWANVVAEAMAGGLPVVAFDCDFGPADIIDHDVNGLLVEPESAVALASALRTLLADQALRDRLAAAARTRIERYEASKIADRWLDLIADVAAAR